MNKKFLLAAGLALISAAASAQEVKIYNTGRKWSQSFDALVKGNSVQRIARRGAVNVTPDSTLRVLVTTAVGGAETVKQYVENAGYEAELGSEQLVVASIPARFIATLGKLDEVLYINEDRQLYSAMSNVRSEMGADKVQEGTGLDTPYDGTGVIVGVIDQGFEFRHPAFSGASQRWGSSASTGTLRTSAPYSDPNDQVGHATHVANIAVGRKVDGVDYYGVAPGAELLPMMSDLNTSSIIVQARAIRNYANEQGKPWVINMSFGSVVGPHDGTTDIDQALDALSGKGAILVGAMGNDGAHELHAMHTFTEDGEKAYFHITPDLSQNTNKIIATQIWAAEAGDDLFDFKPVVLSRGKVYYPTAAQLVSSRMSYTNEVSPFNNKQNGKFAGYFQQLLDAMGLSTGDFMWEITGKAGHTCHAWINYDAYPATFDKVKFSVDDVVYTTPAGDGEYSTGESSATVPSSIGVASYNNAQSYIAMNGSHYSLQSFVGSVKDLSTFSTRGPSLSTNPDALPKPTIAAPGGVVISAFSKKSQDFNTNSTDLVQRITSAGNSFYYGVMSGTSMATPVVTGTIALWLQANPELTSKDIAEIMNKTARRDSYTGRNLTWDAKWGYGKIDAYEGLKEAIRIRTGINETFNTSTPITLQKGDNAWKVLFNNDESYADIRIVAANGQVVSTKHITAPMHGDEHVVSLEGLTPGVYVFQVQTTASNVTRKMVVK